MTLNEEFLCPNCDTRSKQVHACQEPISIQKMPAADVAKLKFLCVNCGRVSDEKSKLCQPEELNPSAQQVFIKAVKGTGVADVCAVCGQPVSPPGHICDPKGLPYTCEHCKKEVSRHTHMCKEIVEKAQYSCKDCGRVAVKKESLCAPYRLE